MRKIAIAGFVCAGIFVLLSPASANVATGVVGKTIGQEIQSGEARVIQVRHRHRHWKRHHHHRRWGHRHHRRHWYGLRIRRHHHH